jgi:amino acid transporter
MASQLFATKSLEQVLKEESGGEHRLKRVLGPWSLVALGVGAVIGAGIFVSTGKAANETAGPALMVSYMVAGFACIMAALCYAEFASMAPVAGSAYTYAYTTMGELFAWIIGWDLVLEYAVGAATVANGWSSYFQSVLSKIDIGGKALAIPFVLSGGPFIYDDGKLLPNVVAHYEIGGEKITVSQKLVSYNNLPADLQAKYPEVKAELDKELAERSKKRQEEQAKNPGVNIPENVQPNAGDKFKVESWINRDNKAKAKDKPYFLALVGNPEFESKITNKKNAWFDLAAVMITLMVTYVLIKGIQESAFFNAIMVAIKVAAVIFVIVVGANYINFDNYTPFAPYGWTGLTFFGHPLPGTQLNAGGEPVGVIAGAAIIFFAYIGFDAVSTQAEEAKNPKRDIPFGIIVSLLVCTILYIAVVAVLTGMVKYDVIDKGAGVSSAFKTINLGWAEGLIAIAGVAGITSVLLVMMLSAPRVFLAMARDGLLPTKFFADVHPKFQTPWKSTIVVGAFVAIAAGILPIDALLHLTNIGTLFAFVIVCAAVLVMRKTNPNAERPFRCPLVPVVPALGILMCLTMMFSLPAANWLRLIVWLGIGFVIYFLYGIHHSKLKQRMDAGQA